MRILVLHPGALGDIILSLPALQLLRFQLKGARLTVGGHTDYLAAVASGVAERILSLGEVPLHRLYADDPLRPEDLRFWQSFDRVLSWTGHGTGRFADRLKRANPHTLVRSWKPEPSETRHASRIFAESLAAWIEVPEDLQPAKIPVSPFDLQVADSWLGETGTDASRVLVAIHPGAGGTAKRWPLERYRSLVEGILADRRTAVIILEGPAEPRLAVKLSGDLASPRVTAAASLSLRTVAGILHRCRAFVGNDSGIAHLAASAGAGTIVLFGPTRPELWAPLGRRVLALRNPDGCRACLGREKGTHRCLANISVQQVLEALNCMTR